jgi:hypothetical protein
VQGTEWLPKGDFKTQIALNTALQDCARRSAECIRAWSVRNNRAYSYVYIVKNTSSDSDDLRDCCSTLKSSLDASRSFSLVFENSAVAIYKRME